MEQDKTNMYACLIEWLQIFNGSEEQYTANALSDGFIFAKSLNQIDSSYFSEEKLLSKIKQDANSNWRLKVSNLRKILDALYDYYSDVMGINLTDQLKPDVNKIGEKCDKKDIGKLVQLILGCAVNCTDKEQYITQIMELEEELQRNIMRAIQDIEYIWQNVSPPKTSMSLSMDIKQITEERDALAQRCHESDMQISTLLEDKTTLMQEMAKLQQLVDRYENPDMTIGDDGTSLGPAVVGSARYNELRKQVASLKEDLLQAETAKDDLKMKCIQSEKEIIILQAKIEDLTHYQIEVASLRDEIDALKESNEKAKLFEKQLEVYKKKMEDYNDLKRQLKTLEERSAQYAAENRDFESTTKDKVKLKGQLDLYKKEIDDLNERLDTELQKIMRYEYDIQNLNSKLTSAQRERDALRLERDQLKDTVDELRCDQNSEFSGKTVSSELGVPAAFREKMERLDAENKALRTANGGQTALIDLLAEANTRADKLREQLKDANQKILHLQDASSTEMGTDESSEEKLEKDSSSNAALLASLQAKIANLESTVSLKNHDLTAAEVRYKKLLEKAKEVIKTVDQNGTVDELLSDKSPDSEVRSSASMSQLEERLMASAYYNLGISCQRDAVDARVALLNSPGQSFLARQRQPAPRKPLIATSRKQ